MSLAEINKEAKKEKGIPIIQRHERTTRKKEPNYQLCLGRISAGQQVCMARKRMGLAEGGGKRGRKMQSGF